MGLDITAYSHLRHIGRHTDEWCDDEDHVQAYAYDSFPKSFRGIPVLSTKQSGTAVFLEGGCYERTDKTKTIGFRAGSYGGYGAWRSDLARQFNPTQMTWGNGPSMTEPDPDGPFYELIWFADNEGSIGPEAAADLLVDFQQHAGAYAPTMTWSDMAREKYRDWTRACELAAEDGLICFH